MKLLDKKLKKKKGFTLVELVVVIAILGVLALILVPSISGYVTRANTERDHANVRSLYTAAVLAVSENATDVAARAKELASIPAADTVTVAVTNGVVTSVTYKGVTFNGTTFTP